jgi:hypothetical protein
MVEHESQLLIKKMWLQPNLVDKLVRQIIASGKPSGLSFLLSRNSVLFSNFVAATQSCLKVHTYEKLNAPDQALRPLRTPKALH